MLRLYRPLENHDIFKLQGIIESLVMDVWCKADRNSCASKVNGELKNLYDSYSWLKKEIDTIYKECRKLNKAQLLSISKSFTNNNSVERLCRREIDPVQLGALPAVVRDKIKPLFVDFYEQLLEKAKVPGTKKDYYEKLVQFNEFQDCPCCGLTYFEPADSANREAFDHYLPKAHYPFASINFKNLVPLCSKCNSDRKKAKDPIEGGRKAYYPFSENPHRIDLQIIMDKGKDLRYLERDDVTVAIVNEKEEDRTWDTLFDIKERYNDTSRGFIKKLLARIKRRHLKFQENDVTWSYVDTLNWLIDDYEHDRYDAKKFLQIPILIDLLDNPNLIEVYDDLQPI